MYNLVHMFVAVLKELGIISEEGATALSRELSTKILPSNPEDAMQQVGDAVRKVEEKLGGIVKSEPWLAELHMLENRVASLEKPLTKASPKNK